jgi:short-subunit dehydrogenase
MNASAIDTQELKQLPSRQLYDLRGKRAFVTGASSGIGHAVAVGLAESGAHLHVAGRRLHLLQAFSEQYEHVSVHHVDLCHTQEVLKVAYDVGGEIDILVHCAGAYQMGGIYDVSETELDELFAVNVRAPYALTRCLLPTLIERKGQIVFCNSTAGLQPSKEATAYAASKHALRALTDSLRAEINPMGVRVIAVYPGRTNTPMQEAIFSLEGREYVPERLLQPEDIASVIINALCLPGTAEVTDLVIRPMVKA